MADDAQTNGSQTGWMSDVQRALALILVASFAIATMIATVCSIWWPSADALVDMAKTLQAALVNMSLIGLGFFFGNTSAKMTQDAGQQKVVEKLTGAPTPVVPPLVAPPMSWWLKLSDPEKNAITAEAPNDPRVAAFITAAQAGAANADDLAHLVSKNLLTQVRADEIKAA